MNTRTLCVRGGRNSFSRINSGGQFRNDWRTGDDRNGVRMNRRGHSVNERETFWTRRKISTDEIQRRVWLTANERRIQ